MDMVDGEETEDKDERVLSASANELVAQTRSTLAITRLSRLRRAPARRYVRLPFSECRPTRRVGGSGAWAC